MKPVKKNDGCNAHITTCIFSSLISNFPFHLVGMPYDMKLIRVIALLMHQKQTITIFHYIENILNKEDISQADIPYRIVFTLFFDWMP